MPSVGFDPTIPASNRVATGIGSFPVKVHKFPEVETAGYVFVFFYLIMACPAELCSDKY
jgi:hypothetical protein